MIQSLQKFLHIGLACRLVLMAKNDFSGLGKGKKIDTSLWASELYFLIPLRHKQHFGGKVTRENLKEKLDSLMELFQ